MKADVNDKQHLGIEMLLILCPMVTTPLTYREGLSGVGLFFLPNTNAAISRMRMM